MVKNIAVKKMIHVLWEARSAVTLEITVLDLIGVCFQVPIHTNKLRCCVLILTIGEKCGYQ